MPRKRMISPDIWTDEGFIELSPMARLLFIGLISHADDHGRGVAASVVLKSKIFPADHLTDVRLTKLMSEITRKLRVHFYSVDGRAYYQLDRWNHHQYVQRPQESTIPEPTGEPELDFSTGALTEPSVNAPLSIPPNRIEKKRIEKKGVFADNVTLTEEEHGKLLAAYGSANTRKLIDKLDNFKGSKGRQYKSDYRAILSWVVDALGLQPLAPKTSATWKCPDCGTTHTSSYKVCECGYGR